MATVFIIKKHCYCIYVTYFIGTSDLEEELFGLKDLKYIQCININV